MRPKMERKFTINIHYFLRKYNELRTVLAILMLDVVTWE